jgi:predicted nucleic acid-binding protein
MANTASTVSHTVATTANTTATTANTAATVVNTTAQNAWNVAKAVAKALLGDWTGLVLVGAVALGAYALATDDSTDALEK